MRGWNSYGYVRVVRSLTLPDSARPRTGVLVYPSNRPYSGRIGAFYSSEWTNIFGPIPRKMPFLPA